MQARSKLAEMHSMPGDVLYASHTALTLLANSDVENVLFTNIDATGDKFKHLAGEGASFEFIPEDPLPRPAPRLCCCSTYEMAPYGRPSAHWTEHGVLAEWSPTATPSLATATSSRAVWWELRCGDLKASTPGVRPTHFGIHMVLHTPVVTVVNLVSKIKMVMDAAVLALCSENGRSTPEGLRAFAAASGHAETEVRALMFDRVAAVFGPCGMVSRSGQAQPPDSCCVYGSLVLQRGTAPDWRLSGRVVALTPAR